ARVELELRHRRMAGDNAFSQRLLQRLDRITFMQFAERRRRRQRARTGTIDRMTFGQCVRTKTRPLWAGGESASSAPAGGGSRAELATAAARKERPPNRLVQTMTASHARFAVTPDCRE